MQNCDSYPIIFQFKPVSGIMFIYEHFFHVSTVPPFKTKGTEMLSESFALLKVFSRILLQILHFHLHNIGDFEETDVSNEDQSVTGSHAPSS